MRLFNETFRIVEARVRDTEGRDLPRPFFDGTGGPFDRYGLSVLSLTDADGITGHTLGGGGDTARMLLRFLCGPEPVRYGDVYPKMYWKLRNGGFRGPFVDPLSNIDRCLADIAAQRAGLPLHRYLGADTDTASAYASGGSVKLTPNQLLDELEGFVTRGFSLVKMKVGTNFGQELDSDVERVRTARAHLGPKVRIAVDANQAFSPDQALEFAEKIAHLEIAWFEEPVHSADLVAIEKYCRDSPIVAAFGESERCSKVFPSLVNAGVRHLQPNPTSMTSILEWFEVRDLARQHGLALSLPGHPQIGAIMAATAPDIALSEILFPVLYCFPELFARAPELDGDKLRLPTEPGAAIRFDFERWAAEGWLREDKSIRLEPWPA